MQRLAFVVEVLDEFLQAALGVEGLLLFLTKALVLERDHHILVQKRQLTQPHA